MDIDLLNTETQLGMFVHVMIASALAGLVGFERELSQKPAGFRTHVILGGVAALLILLGRKLIESYHYPVYSEALQTDPLRILEAIIVGVSFIGAGTILKMESQNVVRFLTTAAATLLSAGIGVTVALQLYYLAIGIAVFTVSVTFLLGRVDRYLAKKMNGEEG